MDSIKILIHKIIDLFTIYGIVYIVGFIILYIVMTIMLKKIIRR
jgi:hypothetical protein